MTDQRETRLALLALPESAPLALYGLFEVFHSVGRTWSDMTGEANTPATMTPVIAARNLDPIVTSIGVPVSPQVTLGAADVVIVTDIAIDGSFDPAGRWREECAWLRERYDAGAIICSVCTGSLVIAQAGLLDGKIATSHWSAIELFRKLYPGVDLRPERVLTTAGDGDRIITGGGASSWEDLALYLVARFSSGEEAVRIAKIFLFGERTEGQMQFAGARRAHRHDDATIAEAQAWAARNYRTASPVATMAARSGLNERTFNRRFRAATGYSPIDYVQTMRIEEAKQLLESSSAGVDEISAEVGYADAASFRRLFRKRTGITPARYRQRFAPIARLARNA